MILGDRLPKWLSGEESTCQGSRHSLIPGSEISHGGENGNPLQYSCQDNPMDRGAWWTTAHGVTKSWTWLSMSAMASRSSPQDHIQRPELERLHGSLTMSSVCTLVLHGIGEGHGTQLQYSCWENPMDGGAWWATVHEVAQSRLKRLSSSSYTVLLLGWERE